MIEKQIQKVEINQIIESQIPNFLLTDENDGFVQLLKQYYISQEFQGSSIDLVENIPEYKNPDIFNNEDLISSTSLTSSIQDYTDEISVVSTLGWPSRYGLLKIDDEIITYESKTETKFLGCIRGFSGIEGYNRKNEVSSLVFSTSSAASHSSGASVSNLSNLFLKELLFKSKSQFAPGFENYDLAEGLDQTLFLKRVSDFYKAKGTDESFKTLFKILYNKSVTVIKPQDYLIKPSDAEYLTSQALVVDFIEGENLTELETLSITQNRNEELNLFDAIASISSVETLEVGNTRLYKLILDSSTISGEFGISGRTKTIESISANTSTINVDSTIGFPASGSFDYFDSFGDKITINYTSKTVNQFLGCTGVLYSIPEKTTLNYGNYAYIENPFTGIKTTVKLLKVINNIQNYDTTYYSPNDYVTIKSFGEYYDKENPRLYSWISNTRTSYNVASIEKQSSMYKFTLPDSHEFLVGDKFELYSVLTNSIVNTFTITQIISDNQFLGNFGDFTLDVSKTYYIKKVVQKVISDLYPHLNPYIGNVSNIYTNDTDVYVASNSLPVYMRNDTKISVSKNSRSFTVTSGNFLVSEFPHAFYSGEKVYAKFSNSSELNNNYYVKVIDSLTVKLSKSSADVFSQQYIEFSEGQTCELTLSRVYGKEASAQPILRKIKKYPEIAKEKTKTTSNNGVGILINGVELLSYKSNDYIAYGPIDSIKILNSGNGYDVINPPVIIAEDNFSGVGTGAVLIPHLTGSLNRIDILDPGFDLLGVPEIVISGGNGSGAKASAKIRSIEYSAECKSNIGINTANDFITFESPHKFKNGEEVFYLNLGTQAVGVGTTTLINGATYFVNVISSTSIKLSNTKTGSLTNTDIIDFNSVGNGIHKFQSVQNKNVLSSVVVENSGSGYKNAPRIVTSTGINTFTSSINFKSHGFNNSEKVVYSSSGTIISGLSTTSTYYALKIDEDNFRLCSSLENLANNIYVNLNSTGSGYHTFNYEPITVTINSKNGFGLSSYNPSIRPIFLGSVDNVVIKSGGKNYGNSEILNFEANPLITTQEPSPAELKPVIVNGKIKEVIIDNSGSGYISAPNLIVGGKGNGAKLVASLNSNGGISSVYVESAGNGYDIISTSIIPETLGNSLVLEAKVKKWTFDRVKKFETFFKDDDGIFENSKSLDNTLQFYSIHIPKELRKLCFTKNNDGSKNYNYTDYDNNVSTTKYHSPILGWAYDGCPIYGQYGYSSESGGDIKKLKSGYSLKSSRVDGPSNAIYPLGTFVEDYVYSASGDLDEFNGRYCITPDFPSGVYAYFATNAEFPYTIGDSFACVPDKSNLWPYTSNLNQNINYSSLNLKRYTYPYRISSNDSYYDYFNSPLNSLKFPLRIDKVTSGKINSFSIISSGNNYSVGDKILNNIDGEIVGEVNEVVNEDVISIATTSFQYSNCPLLYDKTTSQIEVFTNINQQFNNLDVVSISGVSTSNFESIQGFNRIGITSFTYNLTVGLGVTTSTGIITSIYLSNIKEISPNKILKINNENLLVLNVFEKYNSVRVQREYNSVGTGQSYSVGQPVSSVPSSFKFISGISTDFETKVNNQIYFSPQYSVGVSTLGIGVTISIYTGIGYTSKDLNPKSIYLPNHNLKTGQKLIYSNGGGTSIGVSTNGTTAFYLGDGSYVYVAKYNNDEIGISTTPIGIGSTGFIGIGTNLNILYFNSLGVGEKHSFKTTFTEVTTNVSKNISTVLVKNNYSNVSNIDLVVLPNQTTYLKLVYDDSTRRLLINPKNSSSVDVLLNTITIDNHGYSTGDKVLYKTSGTPIGGLSNNSYYYVIKQTESLFKLVEAYSSIFNPDNNIVNVTNSGSGTHTFYLVNPKLNLYKGNTILFDTSDSSLSEVISGVQTSVFSFDIYTDPDFSNRYAGINSSITKTGFVGVGSTSNVSNLTLKTDELTPSILYYGIKPLRILESSDSKKNFTVDTDVNESFKISLSESLYNGLYSITGIGTTTFSINLKNTPESLSYNQNNSNIKYKTTEFGSSGKINSTRVTSTKTYSYPVTNLSVQSLNGSGALLSVNSSEIGKISDVSSLAITSEIPSDPTLVPIVNFPQILRVDESSSLKFVGVSSGGKKYTYPPKLIVLDSTTNSIVPDVELEAVLSGTSIGKVNIISNTKSLYDFSPRIISTDNSNGIGINTISYNNLTKTVVVSLAASFSVSSDYPFEIGKNVYVENIGISTATDYGFNSSDYNYISFQVVGVNTNLGGAKPTVSYKLPDWASNATVGILTCIAARIIPEQDLPIFNAVTEINSFSSDEIILSNNKFGKNVSWDKNSKLLKVNALTEYNVGDIIIGKTSGTKARVIDKYEYFSDFSTGALTKPFKFFNKETGKISESFQRFEDSDYNQLFAYSLKSEIPYETWKSPVLGLSHVAGYKPFCDLQVISTGTTSNTDVKLNEVKSTVEIFNQSSVLCRTDYDYAYENNININDKTYSNQISFNSKVLTDYIQSKTNRALLLDDISSQFNSNPRVEKYSSISEFEFPTHRYVKNFIFVKDTLRTNDRALYQVTFLNDDPNFEQLTYGSNWTSYDLGYFDIQKVTDTKLAVQFYPYNYEFNNFNVTTLSIALLDTQRTGITTQSLGTIGALEVSPRVSIAASSSPIATQIIGFSTTKYTSSKVLVTIQSNLGLIQSNELTLVHNGNNVIISEYAEMISDENYYGTSGIGTYGADITGGNVVLKFTPNVGVGVTIVCHQTSIAPSTGIGTTVIGGSYVDSNYVSIASTTSPVATAVCGFAVTTFSAAYIIAEVKNTSTKECQISELVLITDSGDTYLEEYNVNTTNSSFGNFSSTLSGSSCNLTFTPNSGVGVEVRTVKFVTNEKNNSGIVTYTDAELKYQYGRYTSTRGDVKTAFQLTHNTYPLFYKEFDGSSSSVVNLTDNVINIPSHYFSNGEKLTYSYDVSPIGIATTTITGIGTTNKLPSNVYVIKIDENKIRLAASASDALSTPKIPLVFSSVGIGTSHSFNPEKQNTKVLITIDNITQSPIVPNHVSYTITEEFTDLTSLVKLTGIKDISSGDILKIDNEYVKVVNVGIATTNGVVVTRGIFDTDIVTHSVGTTVRKYIGSYNIIKNTLYFVDPPYGKLGINSDQYSTFHARSFLRTGQPGSAITAYTGNYTFDDVSDSFTGIGKTFTLKNNGNDITGISTNNGIILINNIPQVSGPSQNYTLNEVLGTTTNIVFNGSNNIQSYDVNTTEIPRSGVINEYSPNTGFGLQPLIGAGATAIVSVGGTISSVSIGNSGSGYRSGIQTTVYVRATNPLTGITTNIGVANVTAGFVTSISITNPGSGFTSTNPPAIQIDKPLVYQNLSLLGGSGIGAKVDIVVGQGSSVIDFNITNYGYGYRQGDILYVATGGTTGIQTVSTAGAGFTSFSITVNSFYNDSFAGWTFGELQTLDDLTPYVDGVRKTFTLKLNQEILDLRAKDDSLIDLATNLIILRNGIVQAPNSSYVFNGGSRLQFTEAPLIGDKIQVMFYKGSQFDSEFIKVEPTIKPGDKVQLLDFSYGEEQRIVKDNVTSDLIETNYYGGTGVTTDVDFRRILTWCKQRQDLIIDGVQVSKSRDINNSKLIPVSNIIKPVSIGSTEIFVQSAQPLFNEFDDLAEVDLNVIILNSSSGIGTTDYASYEQINSAKISGDFGIVSGVGTTIVGVASTALTFDFVIPLNSALRNTSVVGSAITVSGITSGYYFVISDSNVGNGLTSISRSGSIVGIGTSFIDNVYEVYSTQVVNGNAFGIGSTTFLRVTTLVNSYAGITTGTNNFYGKYSWGRIYDFNGTTSKSFSTNNLNGLTGLSTAPSVIRTKQIRTPY